MSYLRLRRHGLDGRGPLVRAARRRLDGPRLDLARGRSPRDRRRGGRHLLRRPLRDGLEALRPAAEALITDGLSVDNAA